MVEKVNIEEFLVLAGQFPVLDVRSPSEYAHAHIPGAVSFPLFSDEERKVVGTAYKQQGREQAIKIGLDYFGVKMRSMVEEAEKLLADVQTHAPDAKTVLVHCWRGGMRSAGVAWLLDLYGYKVYTLAGGYKEFRTWVLAQFEVVYSFKILGGYTGSGKTRVLHEMAKEGATIIDLEGIAHHKGSAFGDLGELPQPGQEMFENKLAIELNRVQDNESIWLEDESKRIGNVNLPAALWTTMRKSPLFFLEVPFEDRLKYINEEYGVFSQEQLISATDRIRKRLGNQNAKNAIEHFMAGNTLDAFRILLGYYDKYYGNGLHDRESLEKVLSLVPCNDADPVVNCRSVLGLFNTKLTAPAN